jgi:uncharacterized protein GlcG (DUF336 family)
MEERIMKTPRLVLVAAALATLSVPAIAQQSGTYTMRLMTPETAIKAVQAAVKKCQDGGFQVAAAVVDRAGNTQALMRDRFAGAHTVQASQDKAWTAVSFRTDTAELADLTQANKASSGIRAVPRVLAIGGGLRIEAGGSLLGAIGVSGAPGGREDDACAKAGIDAIKDALEF